MKLGGDLIIQLFKVVYSFDAVNQQFRLKQQFISLGICTFLWKQY